MSEKKVIAASLSVDTEAAQKNVLALNNKIADLRKELKASTAGTDEQFQAFKKLKAAEEELTKAQKDLTNSSKSLGDESKGVSGHFSNIKEGLGKVNPAFNGATEGVGKLSGAFKVLLANPVVLILAAIVGLLYTLYKAFTNTFEGAQKVEQVFAGIKAAAQALLDNLDKVASLIKNVFTFNFSGAIKDIKEIGTAAADAFNKMAALTKEAQALEIEQSKNDLERVDRQNKLSQLREKAVDETVPIKERLKLGKQLLEDSRKNAVEDIDLAKRTAANKIAQLTLEKDGARKNQIEINAIRAEALKSEIENNTELRNIEKQNNRAEKQAVAEEKEKAKAAAAEAKEARQKAAAEAKEERQKLAEFTNKLLKLQQENELTLIKDGYQRELKQLEIKIADEKRANEVAFADKKITKEQQQQLDAAIDISSNLQKQAITDKHNEDLKVKEEAFQKELRSINQKIKLDGITDTHQKERLQLKIGYEEKLQDAIKRYKEDAFKLKEIKAALDAQFKADQDALDEKERIEKGKKDLERLLKQDDKVFNDPKSSLDLKKAVLDAEQALIQNAFDAKVLSEEDYTNKVDTLTEKRKTILELETAHKKAQSQEVAGVLDKLSSIIGKQTIAGKALGIATALINTYQGASEALKQKSVLPSPFDVIAKIVNVAAVIATGIATVKAITAVQVPGGGGGAGVGSPPNISAPSAPLAPQNQSTRLDQASINGIGNATNQPVQAYVVESQGADTQERISRLNRQAKLGG